MDERIHYGDNTKFNALVKKALFTTGAVMGVVAIVVLAKRVKFSNEQLDIVLEANRNLSDQYLDLANSYLGLTTKYLGNLEQRVKIVEGIAS